MNPIQTGYILYWSFVIKQTVHSSRLSFRKSCMRTLSPDKLSLLLLSKNPIQLKTLSAWVLVAGTQRNFLASLTRVGYCCLLVLHHPRGSLSLSNAGSFLYLPGDDNKKKTNDFFKVQISSLFKIKPSELSIQCIFIFFFL